MTNFDSVSEDTEDTLHNRVFENNFCFLISYYFTILYVCFYTTCDSVYLPDTSQAQVSLQVAER